MARCVTAHSSVAASCASNLVRVATIETEGDHGSSQRKWRVQPACQSISNFKPSASLTYLMTRSKLRSKPTVTALA